METKTSKDKFSEACEKMGSEWAIERNVSDDSRDSIWIGWRTSQWKATILATHNQYVYARMLNSGDYSFDLTIVYGERTAVKRRPLWAGITSIRAMPSANDWLVIGDFNEIRDPSEREGHGNFDRAGATEFENAIAGFTEIATIGGDFTYANGIRAHHTRTRLDKVLGNANWVTKWAQARPMLVLGTTSDHAGLYIKLTQSEKGTTPLKFFNSWLKEKDFNDKFKEAWSTNMEGSPIYVLQQKVNVVKGWQRYGRKTKNQTLNPRDR